MIENIFYIFVALTVFVYLGYPISLSILSIFVHNTHQFEKMYPAVTIIITAYNEEDKIREKIENSISVVYPKEKLQILIASDGSTDRTNEIVESFEKQGVGLLSIPVRGGKEKAQKEAIRRSNGDIIVFTDVATRLDPKGIEQIVSNFSNPSIGCVSSEDRVIGKDGKPSEEGFYVRYEMWLRRLESKVNSLVGLSGSFFAARKSVCQDFSEELDSDFRTLLNSVKKGLRGISDPLAIGYYRNISDQNLEFERKIRTVLRGLTLFFKNIEFLNVFKYGLFSYQYLCHKLLRWLVPMFLIIVFLSNIYLASTSLIYFILFLIQLTSIFFVIGKRLNIISSTPMLINVIIYFITVNMSILIAWYRYLKGERIIIWNPSER